MGLFRKESNDIVDFTLLQKRGILKKETTTNRPLTANPSANFIDVTSSSSPTSSTHAPDLLGFLDSSTSSPSISSLTLSENTEIQSLKVKIDDLEFKLEQLLEKLSTMETRFLEDK
ncbi:MAG: hypothetical protein AABY00_00580 [Nanoarchaeota archaeon]